ncbi:MAG: hypothetical protein ACP5PX_06125 [Candidatus Hadarchaeum sp.]|uniref:hypothetical protein n=1 Tax=Candidatus Hadarchaeum sp. TaxID=2883567 RepID=UPI003D11C024
MSSEKSELRPNLSVLALVSFVLAFLVARSFTTLYPNIVLISGGFHIHHFWFGLAMMAIGGWIGISYRDERADRLAAILFGAGGGLIGDEVGLLLTFGDYRSGITYTLVITFIILATLLILLNRYSRVIRLEFTRFLSSNASLYIGVFMAAVSIAFIAETNDILVIAASGLLTVMAVLIIAVYIYRRLRSGRL